MGGLCGHPMRAGGRESFGVAEAVLGKPFPWPQWGAMAQSRLPERLLLHLHGDFGGASAVRSSSGQNVGSGVGRAHADARVYDKPMVYYPIQTFVNAGIHEISLAPLPNPRRNRVIQLHQHDERNAPIRDGQPRVVDGRQINRRLFGNRAA